MGKYSDCLCIWLCVFIVFVFVIVIVFVFDLHFKVLIGNLSSEVGEAGASKVREGVAASLVFQFFNQDFFHLFSFTRAIYILGPNFFSDLRVFSALRFYRQIRLDLK